MFPAIYFFAAFALVAFLWSRFYRVPDGYFCVKVRRWRRGAARYVGVGSGYHFEVPFFETHVRTEGGTGPFLLPSKLSSPSRTSAMKHRNLSFVIEFKYRVTDPFAFFRVAEKSRGATPFIQYVQSLAFLSAPLDSFAKGGCSALKLSKCDPRTLSDQLQKAMKRSYSDKEGFPGVEIALSGVSQLEICFDPSKEKDLNRVLDFCAREKGDAHWAQHMSERIIEVTRRVRDSEDGTKGAKLVFSINPAS